MEVRIKLVTPLLLCVLFSNTNVFWKGKIASAQLSSTTLQADAISNGTDNANTTINSASPTRGNSTEESLNRTLVSGTNLTSFTNYSLKYNDSLLMPNETESFLLVDSSRTLENSSWDLQSVNDTSSNDTLLFASANETPENSTLLLPRLGNETNENSTVLLLYGNETLQNYSYLSNSNNTLGNSSLTYFPNYNEMSENGSVFVNTNVTGHPMGRILSPSGLVNSTLNDTLLTDDGTNSSVIITNNTTNDSMVIGNYTSNNKTLLLVQDEELGMIITNNTANDSMVIGNYTSDNKTLLLVQDEELGMMITNNTANDSMMISNYTSDNKTLLLVEDKELGNLTANITANETDVPVLSDESLDNDNITSNTTTSMSSLNDAETTNPDIIYLFTTKQSQNITPRPSFENPVKFVTSPASQLNNVTFPPDGAQNITTEEAPVKATMLLIPYPDTNKSKEDVASITKRPTDVYYPTTVTANASDVTVPTKTVIMKGTTVHRDEAIMDTKQVSKPKKKSYEELLPQEKENIVTVVFSQMIGNWTTDFEKSFSAFVSNILTDYLKIWSTVKESGNDIATGFDSAVITAENVHYLKPTPYFSKDLTTAMVTFYVTSTSPTETSEDSNVFPAEIVVQNLKEVKIQLKKRLQLNATDVFIGAYTNFKATQVTKESQFIKQYEPLFVALIAVTGMCLFTLLTAIICFKCRRKATRCNHNNDREKLHKEHPHFVRGHDLHPEHEILRDERQQTGGILNGEKKCLVRQNGEDGWLVPMGDMPYEDLNAPAIQDTRL